MNITRGLFRIALVFAALLSAMIALFAANSTAPDLFQAVREIAYVWTAFAVVVTFGKFIAEGFRR